MTDLWDIARQVTDEVMGEGTYAESNKGNMDPKVQEQVKKSAAAKKRQEQEDEQEAG